MRLKSFVAGFVSASVMVAVAYAQTSSGSSQQSSSSSNSSKQASSSASSSSKSGGGYSGSSSGSSRSIPHPTHAVIYSPGEKWDRSKSVMQQPLIQDHIAYWQKVIPTGKFIWGGPWTTEPGGMNLLVVKSDEEAERLVMGDPAVKGGLLEPDIKGWYVGLDGTLAASSVVGK